MWHECANTDDIIMIWFALYENLVMSHLACATCTHMHGTCALCRNSASKYSSSLGCMQANPKLSEYNHYTFLGTKYTKCKLEHAKHDSHCISQQEPHGLQ